VQSMVRLYESLLMPVIHPPEPTPPGVIPPTIKPVQPLDTQVLTGCHSKSDRSCMKKMSHKSVGTIGCVTPPAIKPVQPLDTQAQSSKVSYTY